MRHRSEMEMSRNSTGVQLMCRTVVQIKESSQVGEARRAATFAAAGLGFSELDIERLALVVNELSKNLVKHRATSGFVVLQAGINNGQDFIDVTSIDSGPGMINVERCMTDGYSTAGTMGTGLGAVKRMANEFDIYSVLGSGTVIAARVYSGPPKIVDTNSRPVAVGAICIPKKSETVCGDNWDFADSGDRFTLTVIDGLGHGIEACDASKIAISRFLEQPFDTPKAIVERMHRGLSGSRGAVGAVAQIHKDAGVIRYAGLGNINSIVLGGERSKHLVSMNGTLGYEARRVEEYQNTWPAGGILIMHSDGCSARFDFSKYDGLSLKSPSVIAGVLYRDHGKDHDDVTICCVKY